MRLEKVFNDDKNAVLIAGIFLVLLYTIYGRTGLYSLCGELNHN